MAIKCINQHLTDRTALYHGDSVEVLRGIPDNSVHYAIYSPPFASLYTYSNSERDLGNCRSRDEFFEHYGFIARELYRVLKPGRLVSFHCMNLPSTKERDGFIGIHDFRGDLIRAHIGDEAAKLYWSLAHFRARADAAELCKQPERAAMLRTSCDILEEELRNFPAQGPQMIFHSEVCIWKDPVTAMQRTKAIGLLYKQLRKDSCLSRQGIPDYLVTMRKPGENDQPVRKFSPVEAANKAGTPEYGRIPEFSVDKWQNYASPVWMDINPSDTLQRESAREDNDERHICPLQLQVIERGIELWTNPGDVVLSPYAGIGSEGYVALRSGRRFVGCELKASYYEQARKNLIAAESMAEQPSLLVNDAGV